MDVNLNYLSNFLLINLEYEKVNIHTSNHKFELHQLR